jgi:hypothetical protein
LDDEAEIRSGGQRRDKRDGADRTSGIDVQQYVTAIIVALDVYLEQLEKWRVLGDELVGQPRCLGCWIGRRLASEECYC